jgi:hypothetical protein
MKDTAYYRERAAQARRLAGALHQRDVCERLRNLAREYDEIAEDLENGAVEIRHPDLMLQRRRQPGDASGE